MDEIDRLRRQQDARLIDVRASSLPEHVKERLLRIGDQRVSRTGIVVIKAQAHRSLERNRAEALARLQSLVTAAAHLPKPRKPAALITSSGFFLAFMRFGSDG